MIDNISITIVMSFINLILPPKHVYVDVDGDWEPGKLCPSGRLVNSTFFRGSFGYDLIAAKEKCAAGCNDRDDCFFANLFYGQWSGASDWSTCYLRGKDCGDWQTNEHRSYNLYMKGME